MTDRDIMQQALEALQSSVPTHDGFLQHCKAMNHIRIRLAQSAPPPECKTEEEKTAFAFGWLKAMEAHRLGQQQAQDRANNPAPF